MVRYGKVFLCTYNNMITHKSRKFILEVPTDIRAGDVIEPAFGNNKGDYQITTLVPYNTMLAAVEEMGEYNGWMESQGTLAPRREYKEHFHFLSEMPVWGPIDSL